MENLSERAVPQSDPWGASVPQAEPNASGDRWLSRASGHNGAAPDGSDPRLEDLDLRATAAPAADAWGEAWRAGSKIMFTLRVVDGDFLLDAVNPAFEASTGLSNARLAGQALEDVLPKAIAANLVGRCRNCLSGASSAPVAMIMPLPEGRAVWEIALTPTTDANGAVVRIYASGREVSETAEAHAALSIEGLRAEVHRSPNIKFTALPDGRVERVGEHFLSPAGQMRVRIHPNDVARVTPSPDIQAAGGAVETDIRVRQGDGPYRWFRVRAELVDGLAGYRWYGVAIELHPSIPEGAGSPPSEESHPNLLAHFGDCSVTVDRAWRVTSVTPEAASSVGLTEADLLGVDCRRRLPMPKILIDTVESSLASGIPLQIEIPAPAHPERWMEFQVHPFEAGASILFCDVTERRLADQSVHSATELLQSLLDGAPAEMALLDPDGVIVSVNAAWREAFALLQAGAAPSGVGAPYLEVCRSTIPDLDESALRHGFGEVMAGRSQDYAQPYVTPSSGGLRWRQVRIIPFRLEPASHFIAIHEDITDVARAQAALRNTTEQLLTAQEEERWRIANELHDSTSQHLVAIKLGIIRLRRLTGGDEAPRDLLAEMSRSVQEAAKEIRVLSYLMQPPSLARRGLESTARRFVSGFGARTGLNAAFRAEGRVDALSNAVQHAAFRVIQEALSNVYRHADAACVAVELACREGALTVRIVDDGKGIPILQNGEFATEPSGMGVAAMRVRASQVGGDLTITSSAAGTVVEARFAAASA